MDAGLDTGDILLQRATPIGESETSIELVKRLSLTGADLLSETLETIDSLTPVKQDELRSSLAPILKKEDGLVSWMLTAEEIAQRVRGFQPFPTAFTFFHEKRLTIWRARPVDIEHRTGQPGEVLAASGDDLTIFCGGDSVLKVEEIQPEGKRRMLVRDFLNGAKIAIGDVLK
jgi:methionyl-tRNA formyltransferase